MKDGDNTNTNLDNDGTLSELSENGTGSSSFKYKEALKEINRLLAINELLNNQNKQCH